MSQQYDNNNNKEIAHIKNLLKLIKSRNNDCTANLGQVKTGPAQLGNGSNHGKRSLIPQYLPPQQQTANLSNNESNHVHSESQSGALFTLPSTSSNNNSEISVLMKRPKPYSLHRRLVCPETKCLNSLKDLCRYDADYRGPFNVMGIVHRVIPPYIQSDSLIETNLVIVDQSMIEVPVTVNETKLSKNFYRGQVVMLKNAQMSGKILGLRVNNYQIESKLEKTDELDEWYLINQYGKFRKMVTFKQD